MLICHNCHLNDEYFNYDAQYYNNYWYCCLSCVIIENKEKNTPEDNIPF